MYKVVLVDSYTQFDFNFECSIDKNKIAVEGRERRLIIESDNIKLIDWFLQFSFLIFGYVPKISEVQENEIKCELFSAEKYNTRKLYISKDMQIVDTNSFLTRNHFENFLYKVLEDTRVCPGYDTLFYSLMYFFSESYANILNIHKLTLLAQTYDFVNKEGIKYLENLIQIFERSYENGLLQKLSKLLNEFGIKDIDTFYKIIKDTRHGVSHLVKKKESLLGNSNERNSLYFFELCLYTYRIYIFKELVSNDIDEKKVENYFSRLLKWYNRNKKV